MKVNFGLIGYGAIAPFYLHAFNHTKIARLVSISTLDLEKRSEIEKNGLRFFADYKLLLKDPSIQAVIVATPNYLHSSITVAALYNGKHVLCEKPMATSLNEANQMVSAAYESKKTLVIAFHNRFNQEVERVKKLLKPGKVIRKLSAVYSENIFDHCTLENTWYLNRQLCGGGCIIDNGTNVIDVIYELLGPFMPVKVLINVKKQQVEVSVDIQMSFHGTGLGEIKLDWNALQEEKHIQLWFDDGQRENINFLSSENDRKGSHMFHEYEALLDNFIQETIKNTHRGKRGLAIQTIMDSIYKIAE